MTSGQGKVQLLSTIGLVMCLFLAGTPANVSFAQETFAGVPARNRHITKPIVDSSCTFPCPDVIACSAFPGSPSPARGLACTTILQLHQGTILEAAKAVACPFCTPAYPVSRTKSQFPRSEATAKWPPSILHAKAYYRRRYTR